MKVIILKHAIFLEKEFILREANGSKVDNKVVQQTTNEIDQLDEPMAEPAFDEAQIENGKSLISKDIVGLHKSSRVIRLSQKYDFLITSDALLIEEDEPTTYTESKSNVDSKR
ncbi:hypothetical protein Adt_18729 [Abeliophyllum distichum]|uniref:Uncharacterized protein n=1 Tax=Abeliophyllum distichum TaxID=126358 RepID=A0ABD1TKC7_9LAMI